MTDSTELLMGSPDRFGHSWQIYSEVLPQHAEQFRRWTTPLAESDWRGVRFLDVGCGIGRNAYWAMSYGAASCVAIDVDDRTLAAARHNLSRFSSADVRRQSIYELTEVDAYDLVFSIGVVHHLANPEAAIKRMAEAVKPGGRVLVWLYGYENNEWIVRYFDPLRRMLFSRLPLRVVHWLSLLPTVLLWLGLRCNIAHGDYALLLKGFSFRHLRAIVYDHMIPRIARYYRKSEAIKLLEQANLEIESCIAINQISWTVIGRKV